MLLAATLGCVLIAQAPPPPPTGSTRLALDFKDQPVVAVVRALGERTGGLVELFGAADPRATGTRVTLVEPAPVPFWEAIDRVASAGGLRWTVTSPGFLGNGRSVVRFEWTYPPGVADPGPSEVVGPFRLGPVTVRERSGRVFVRPKRYPIAPPDPPPFHAEIPVMAEPGVVALRTGPLKGLEAVDDAGQSLLDPALGGSEPAGSVVASGANPAEPARALVVPLSRAKGASRRLATLRGLVPMEVARRPTSPTTTIPLAGPAGATVRVGDVAITLREFRPAAPGTPGSLKAVARIEGRRGEADTGVRGLRAARLNAIAYHQVELVDARGRSTNPGASFGSSASGDLELAFTFQAGLGPGDIGPPASLRVYRLDWTDWDLPFAFRDLPLP